MDRAFSSPSLLDQLYKNNLGFICGSKTNLNYCKSVINSFARGIAVRRRGYILRRIWTASQNIFNYLVLLTILSTGYRERKPLYIHVYLDPFRAAGEKRNIVEKAEKLQKKLKLNLP